MRRALALFAALLLAACAHQPAPSALAGRIWDPAHHAFVSEDEAFARLAAADIALLGETHDNPVHHDIQRRVLEKVLASGHKPAVGFEQMDIEWQAPIDAALANGADAQALAQAGHVAPGWQWPLYAPIAALALREGLPIVALNLGRDGIRRVMREGFAGLGPGEAQRLALDAVWTPQRNDALRADIVEGHCGEMTPMVDALVRVQRARDALMADRILAHADRGVVAILGRGHARRDLAVPLYLAYRAPARRVVALGLLEVDPDARTIADYPEAASGSFDLVWFTPRFDRPDPCESLKRKK